MIMLVVAFLAGAPLAAVATSAWARHGVEATARLEQATWHPVDAVVLRGVPALTSPYGQSYHVRVPVRWTLDGTAHVGQFEAAPGTPTGATVRVWTGPSGDQTGPPLSPSQITHQATLAGVMSVAGLAFLVIVSAVIIRWILGRRRMAAWDAEWSATGPQWCKYR
jgi:hypothetical protein